MTRRRIIWLTILTLMVIGYSYDTLTFGAFCLLFFIGGTLVNLFDPPRSKPKAEPEEDVDGDPQDVIPIRRRAVEQFRNSLMRHHESRRTDLDYQASAAAQETTKILQVLNAALANKSHRKLEQKAAHQ